MIASGARAIEPSQLRYFADVEPANSPHTGHRSNPGGRFLFMGWGSFAVVVGQVPRDPVVEHPLVMRVELRVDV